MPETLNLTQDKLASTDLGRALLAGKLTATVNGSNDQHVTVKAALKAKIDNRWKNVTWDRATHVFLSVPAADGGFADKIGTYYPQGRQAGMFWSDRTADETRIKAALYVLRSAHGDTPGTYVQQGTFCLRCGKELTTPQSIAANFGPDCAVEVGAYHEGNGEHAPKVKGGDGTGDGQPVDQWADDLLRDLSDVELDRVIDKSVERAQKNPDEGNRRREQAAIAERTKRNVERDQKDGTAPRNDDDMITLAPGESATDKLATL